LKVAVIFRVEQVDDLLVVNLQEGASDDVLGGGLLDLHVDGFKKVLQSTGNQASQLIIRFMCGIDSHHGEGFSGAGLAVCKDGAVVAFETVEGAFLAYFEEHVMLGVVIGDGVEGEFFILIGIKSLYGVGVVFDVDADAVVFVFLSGLGEGYF
jgi:hypothetical protein